MTPADLRSEACSLEIAADHWRSTEAALWTAGLKLGAQAAGRKATDLEDSALVLNIRASELEAEAMARRELMSVVV